MKTLSFLILILFSTSFFAEIKAQQPKTLDLKQSIQMALDSNLYVRSAAYTVDEQKALKGAAWDIPKTNIDGQYGRFNSYTLDNAFTVTQSFAFPTTYLAMNKLAKASIKSSEWQLKTSQLEIATQVKQVYWQIAYLLSKQKLLIYQDSLFTGFLRGSELRAKTGETNRLEMITARSQTLEVRNKLQEVGADLDIYSHKLQTLLNSEVAVYTADTLLRRIDPPKFADSLSLSSNPSLGYMQQQTEISHFETKVEKSRAMPDLSVGYFSQTMQGIQEVDGVALTFGPEARFTGVQAGIAIPIWFIPYASRTKAAKIKEMVSQTNAEYYSQSLAGSYQSMLGEFAKYNNSLGYYENQAIPEAVLIIEQANLSYKAGAMDYLDYILTLNRAILIRQNYLDALNNYNQTIISLEFLTGKVL